MTVEQATKRRCTACGRFLSSEADETGSCTSCGTKIRQPTKSAAANKAAAPREAVVPQDAVAVPIEKTLGVAPTRASASLSREAIRPPRGVVIMRPSELHPDTPVPVVRPAPDPLPDAAPEPAPPPPGARPVARAEPVAQPMPEPRTIQAPRIEQAAPIAPIVADRSANQSEGGGPSLMWWTVRIVVGVTMGILIGIAIPFLLSL
jgi:hypothetical protein